MKFRIRPYGEMYYAEVRKPLLRFFHRWVYLSGTMKCTPERAAEEARRRIAMLEACKEYE